MTDRSSNPGERRACEENLPIYSGLKLASGSARVPAVAYLTQAGIDYYQLQNIEPAVFATELDMRWSSDELFYTGSPQGTAGCHVPWAAPVRLLDLTLYFFRYCYNPDPGQSAQPVRRISVLGLDRRGAFRFYREVDFLGRDLPPASGMDFEVFASCFLRGVANPYPHELVVEAGAVR